MALLGCVPAPNPALSSFNGIQQAAVDGSGARTAASQVGDPGGILGSGFGLAKF